VLTRKGRVVDLRMDSTVSAVLWSRWIGSACRQQEAGRTKNVPFSANRPNAGIMCHRLEANPEEDMSNAVQAWQGRSARHAPTSTATPCHSLPTLILPCSLLSIVLLSVSLPATRVGASLRNLRARKFKLLGLLGCAVCGSYLCEHAVSNTA
jgi:hypothetical protein